MVEIIPPADLSLLLDMLLAARDARDFVANMSEASFLASKLHQNAVIRSLEVLGEAASKVSVATQTDHPEILWRDIIGMRHRLIHGYSDVRLELVWLVVQERLDPLIDDLEPLIPGPDHDQ